MPDFRFWRWRQAHDEDIDLELQIHLDLATEEEIDAGLNPREARLAAWRAFGNVSLTREELRGMRAGAGLERIVSETYGDFRHGLRLLRRAPGFTVVAALILALPIAASTVVFSVVNTVLLQRRPGRIDRLVSIFSRDREHPDSYRDFSYPLYEDLRDRAMIFESVMAHTVALVGIREGDTTKRAFAEIVSSNYFSTLGLRLVAGRSFSPDEERPGTNALVVIASYSAWQRAGLDPRFIGSEVRVNGTPFTVVGIAPKGLRTTTLLAPDWWFPLGTYGRLINEWFQDGPKDLNNRANHTLFIAGALRPGLTRVTAEKALDTLALRLDHDYPMTDGHRSFVLTDVPRINLGSRPQSEARVTFIASLLLCMAALVLVIACLNLANLMLARGAVRRREMGIRQALGGGRRRILRQLLVEGLTLAMVGAAVGLVLSLWAHAALSAWLNSVAGLVATGGIDLTLAPSGRTILVAAGLAVISTVCFALGPALRLTRPSLTSDLKNEPDTVVRFGSGSVLVGTQLTISMALLAVAGLFVRGAAEASAANPGFALDHELVFSIDPSFSTYNEARTRDLYRRALQSVRAMPGVEHTSLASKVAFGEFVEGSIVSTREERSSQMPAGYTIITSEYFDTLRIPILRGRAFTPEEDERTAAPLTPAIISEPLAQRLFPDGEVLGQPVIIRRGSVTTGGRGNVETQQMATVVGVVPGTMQDIVDFGSQSQIYVPYGSQFRAAMVLHVGLAPRVDEGAMLSTVRQELRRLDDQLPILTARSMAAQRDASIPRWAVRAAAMTFGMFGGLALLIGVIGVYGLAAYEVTRRTREIGIRMALGATSGEVKRLVLRQGFVTAAVGLSIGVLLAIGIGRLVATILYGVSPLDPAALFAAVFVLGGATLIASYIPARRVTRIAALRALRAE